MGVVELSYRFSQDLVRSERHCHQAQSRQWYHRDSPLVHNRSVHGIPRHVAMSLMPIS
jgi:hypothetical protein